MNDQKSTSLTLRKYAQPLEDNAISLVPVERQFEKVYKVFRIKLQPIYVTSEVRDQIIKSMTANKTFLQIGDYTIMLNTITSIEPRIRDRESINN